MELKTFIKQHPEIKKEYLIKVKGFELDELKSKQALKQLESKEFAKFIKQVIKDLEVKK